MLKNFFKEKLKRASRVLHTWKAELQNDRDIHTWQKKGYITIEEAKALYKANLQMGGAHF